MSYFRSLTRYKCMLCEDTIIPDSCILIHQTRRQSHSLCISCFENYFVDQFKAILTQFRQNIRKDKITVTCSGTYKGIRRNRCNCQVDILNLKVPEECKLYNELTRIQTLVSIPNSYICPNIECSSVMIIEQDYNFNFIECYFCKSKWCRQCLCFPYHDNKTCLEHEISENKTENAKFITKMKDEGKIKFCPACKVPILRSEGCNKMHCESCHTRWCWLCLEKDIDYEHFNTSKTNSCAGKLWLK